jgi:integrase
MNGQRRYRGGLATRELAERVLAKLQADGAASEFGLQITTKESGTLGEHAVGFLERRKRTHAAADINVGQWKNHLAPTFGALRPGDVDTGTIRRFVDEQLATGLSSGTVRIHVALLSSLYEELIEDGLATKNPARGLPKRISRLLKPSYDPRTTPFIERLADVRRIYFDLPEPLNVAYAIGALAGLRTGEVFGLKWRSVDLQARRIHVREQRARKGNETRILKDKESRIVPVLDALLPILKAWKLSQGGEGDALVIPPMRKDGTFIWHSTPGNYLRETLVRLRLDRPGLGWYQATRHTFASQWVMNGNSIEKLKEILGHYSVVVTERYAHLKPELFTEKDLAAIPVSLESPAGEVIEMKKEGTR